MRSQRRMAGKSDSIIAVTGLRDDAVLPQWNRHKGSVVFFRSMRGGQRNLTPS